MRLTQHQIEILKSTANEIFGSESRLLLFGSRIDDSLNGGDIDLYVDGFNCSVEQRLAAKLRFLVQVKRQIGEQRIDLVFSPLPKEPVLPIHQIAEKTGIPL